VARGGFWVFLFWHFGFDFSGFYGFLICIFVVYFWIMLVFLVKIV